MIMQSVSSGESIDSVEEDMNHSFESHNSDHNNLEHKSSDSNHHHNNNSHSRRMMDSPTDVRSYRDRDHEQYYEEESFNTSLTMMGDPLPIVREGSILDDSYEDLQSSSNANGYHRDGEDDHDDHHHDDDDEVTEDFLEYQREQEEFRKEMNRTKIAFAAYRGAVLHLVHNQESFTKKSNNDNDNDNDNKDNNDTNQEDDISEYGSSLSVNHDDNDTINTEDEANERMTRLEDMAKEIVETKAKACFEAVEVVKAFEAMWEEKRQRRRMLLGGLAGVGGQDNVLAELRKMKRKKAEIGIGSSSTSTSRSSTMSTSTTSSSISSSTSISSVTSEPKKAEKKPESKKKISTPKANNNNSHNRTQQVKSPPVEVVGPIVRLKKKPARHPDCIKATLPKFTFQQDDGKEDNGEDDNASFTITSARYRTTNWIKNMVRWRIEKRKHDEAALTKCGCDDCLGELKCMYDNDKRKSFVKQ